MNSQNILKFWGSKFDLKLDTSEFHDYELGKTEVDYNTDVLDLTTPIVYSTLKINTTGLIDTLCLRDRITIVEYDNRINDPTYPYSAYTWTLSYSDFTNRLGNSDTILHNDVYEFVDNSNLIHYFTATSYNSSLDNPFSLNVTGLTTGSPISCVGRLQDEDYCCPIDSPSNAKPWAYQTDHGVSVGNECNPFIQRRTEKGWTLNFVFNREELPWSVGRVFYYSGTRGDSDISDYADNNLSFSFTTDRRIQWRAVYYSGVCLDNGEFNESYYVASGQTPQLCVDGTSEDFEITITFDRYRHLTECNIENDGGFNDLIPDHVINDYIPNTGFTAVTSTQVVSHNETELLSKKWAKERNRRLGVLTIYLNGRPVYKIKDWEEIIPSTRGEQPFIQSWGAGTEYSGEIHNMGISCFNFKRVQYYEEPLDFVHVRHHYLVDTKPYYNINECIDDCPDEVVGFEYVAPIIITFSGIISSGSIICQYDATINRVITDDITLTTTNTLKLNDESILEIPVSITIHAGDLIGQFTQTLSENFVDLNKTFFEYTPLVIDTNSIEQFIDEIQLTLIFSEIIPTPTPTPSSTPPSQGLFFTMQEVGPDVVLSGTGSVNLSSLSPNGILTMNTTFISPTNGNYYVGTTGEAVEFFSGVTLSSYPSFGSGTGVNGNSNTGDLFGVREFGIMVPYLYTGGTLNGTSTFTGVTLATLEVVGGTYIIQWGSLSASETITLTILPSTEPTITPTPTSTQTITPTPTSTEVPVTPTPTSTPTVTSTTITSY